MNSQIQVFNFNTIPVRTMIGTDNEPWFVAKDVCDVLGLSNVSVALRALDSDEKSNISNSYVGENGGRDLRKVLDEDEISNVDSIHIGENGGRAPLLISEAGLYRLIMRSRKPIAKDFQRWVTHVVLPQIRKTGGYVPEGESAEETMARAVLIAQNTINLQKQRLELQEKQLKEQEHKVLFADAVSASDGTCLVGELAKMISQAGYQIGQNRLFQWLREHRYLGSRGSNFNVPTQRSMELGLFKIKETAVTHADGHVSLNRTAKVTGKGQTYFLCKFIEFNRVVR